MIYLITGTPGTGKTSMVLKWVLDNKYGLFKDNDDNYRPIFAVNIPNINRRILPIVDVLPEDLVAKPLAENFDDGSIIIVDEASELYPTRASASKLPIHVDGLNKLRHHGLTLILLTQSPTMIDPFVRALVGKHVHIERKQVGSKLYEWHSVQTSINDSARKDAYSEVYKPDKRTFDLYKSSSKHIKFKKSLSWHWYGLLVFPILAILAYLYAGSRLNAMAGDAPTISTPSEQQASATTSDALASYIPQPTQAFPTTTTPNHLTASDFVPTVPNRPESAPIYDNIRRVADFPQIVGCVQSAKSCRCYTQQATVVEMTQSQCIDHLNNRPFNAYQQPLLNTDKIRQTEAKSSGNTLSSPAIYSLSGQDKLTLNKEDAYPSAQ